MHMLQRTMSASPWMPPLRHPGMQYLPGAAWAGGSVCVAMSLVWMLVFVATVLVAVCGSVWRLLTEFIGSVDCSSDGAEVFCAGAGGLLVVGRPASDFSVTVAACDVVVDCSMTVLSSVELSVELLDDSDPFCALQFR